MTGDTWDDTGEEANAVSSVDVKGDLHGYLRGARDTLVWKLEDLGEYDIRRPLTPTGTNLLGLVKHSAGSHLRYFGQVFGRAGDLSLPWTSDDASPNADLWARPDETRERILALYRKTWQLADATIDDLPLDAVGWVPWWGNSPVTLHHVLVHVMSETQRHAGHADIVRELIDGSVGMLAGHHNLRLGDSTERRAFHDQVETDAQMTREE
jgi:hypothetical protein